MMHKIKTSLELFMIVFVLFLFVIGVGVYGVLGMKKVESNSHELFADKMLSLYYLEEVRFFSLRTLFFAQQANSKQIAFESAKMRIDKAQDSVKINWNEYLYSDLDSNEVQLVSKISVLLKKSTLEATQLKMILEKKDKKTLDSLVENVLFPHTYELSIEIKKLRELQLQMAESTVDGILSDFRNFVNRLVFLLLIVLVVVGPFAYYLIKKISKIVSHHKQNSERLNYTEDKYQSLIENASDAIFLVDEDLKIVEVNSSACELLRYSRDEFQDMYVKDLYSLTEIEKIPVRVAILKKKKGLTDEIELQRKDGTSVEVEISRTLLKDNSYLAIARDITKRKKIETELYEKTELLQLFVEDSPVALAMFDNDMRYIAFSRQWMTDYNLEGKNITGKSHYDIFSDIPPHWKEIHKRCLQGSIESNDEDVFLRQDGSLEWLRWEIRPWYRSAGVIGGLIIFSEFITMRKQADELFKNQFVNSPDTILYVNKKYKIESINRKFFVEMPVNYIIGSDCIEVLSEENREITEKVLGKCFALKKNQVIESVLIQNRWFRLRIVPVVVNEEVTHVMIFATDITKRKQAALKLKQGEEKHRVLTENIGDAIIMVNANLEILYNSPAVEKIAGYSLGNVKLKTVFDLVHPDDYKRVHYFFDDAYKLPGVPLQNQIRMKNKTGSVIWIEGTLINLLEKEGVESYIANYRDITIRKKLEEQQELMASIVNTTDDAIISVDIDGKITSWNVGAEKNLGYCTDEMIGEHVSKLVPLELTGEEKRILEEIRKGFSIDHYETQRLRKDGAVIDVSLTISPIKDTLGKVIGASKIMRDVTEQKQYENDLIHFNAELKKANLELDRFVYSASHDLRAPLKSMLGLIYMMMEDTGVVDIKELNDQLIMLSHSVKKLDDFIEEILHYSRNSRMGLEIKEIDFQKLLGEIKESYRFSEAIREIHLVIENYSDEVFVSDYNRLNIVLSNIFSNALKYRDISKEKSFVKIAIQTNKKRAILIIEDNGIGISKEDNEKIFEMFYRGTTQSSGSGLGLYIVKEALEKLGGTIIVESELHVGTKFIIDIPNQIDNLN